MTNQEFDEMRERQRRARAAQEPKRAVKAEHTIESGDTLSGIALKYYGNASEKYYMEIYEFNKDTIGDDPNFIVVGTVLRIPELPEGF
ncbi:MAG: LysM peptidoglycan-binding domain-containing protein [Anaerolineales bacterium]|nr:LysM peptidoglycan-binding domain-containing protein [Anaerolineales bacterium]